MILRFIDCVNLIWRNHANSTLKKNFLALIFRSTLQVHLKGRTLDFENHRITIGLHFPTSSKCQMVRLQVENFDSVNLPIFVHNPVYHGIFRMLSTTCRNQRIALLVKKSV